MDRIIAEKVITEYLKKIYGFSLLKTANLQDAEDLTQDIVLKIFSALQKSEIENVSDFIWRVAKNTLANYYRGKSKSGVGVCIEDLTDILASEYDLDKDIEETETIKKLQSEIAYLSKMQRKIIIMYYYENKKQDEISDILSIPLGTVKWHLFEAKKEMKKGMESMRESSELKFNPIKFVLCGTNGSPGTKGANNNFFRNALSQNIVYSVWKEAKTINEIADCLGVSPVYVESEAEYLAEYGFLLENKGKFLCNILLDEPNDNLISLHDDVYLKAAKVFANELFDELTNSGILNDKRIICCQTDEPISLTTSKRADNNFILWSLIPCIAALSGEKLMDKSISFEEAATMRPDGGHNICYASVLANNVKQPMYFDSMLHWCGPCWNANKQFTMWQIATEWSSYEITDNYIDKATRALSLLSRRVEGELSRDEYAFLSEMGIEKTNGDYDGMFKSAIQVVWLKDIKIKKKLIDIGDKIKEKYWDKFEKIKAPLIKAVLDETPAHLHKMQKYGMQYLFFSDGWFILHCLKELVNNGKLKLPTEEQRKSLTTIIMPNE